MNDIKIKESQNPKIKYSTIFDSVEWMEAEEKYHRYCMDKGYSGNAYVYSISPHTRYNRYETIFKKTKKGLLKETIEVDILPLDRIMAERNEIWRKGGMPKNYPQTFSKIGVSENIIRRINDHKKTWKRDFHLDGMIRFPDATSAKSFEAFCFDYYKEYKNDNHKAFFQSTEIFFLPTECASLNDALEEYMKSQNDIRVESLFFWS